MKLLKISLVSTVLALAAADCSHDNKVIPQIPNSKVVHAPAVEEGDFVTDGTNVEAADKKPFIVEGDLSQYFGKTVTVSIGDNDGQSLVDASNSIKVEDLDELVYQSMKIAMNDDKTVTLTGNGYSCGFGAIDSSLQKRISKQGNWFRWKLAIDEKEYIWSCDAPFKTELVFAFEKLLSINSEAFEEFERDWIAP